MTITIEEAVQQIDAWRGKQLNILKVPGGITNENYRVNVDEQPYFVSIPGAGTEFLAVDRDNKYHNTLAAAAIGVGPRVVHHLPDHHVMVLEFINGDTKNPTLESLAADCVVINMVLHHTPDPGKVLQDVASCLAPEGVVLVTDLCNHDQGWARENCGDLWLGFDPQDLARWAADAGLTDITSVYLAQRNGFQVQVRLFGHP